MITRRGFVIGSAALGGCAVGTLLLVRALRSRSPPAPPPPPVEVDWRQVPPARLSDAEVALLVATIGTLFDVPETAHYIAAFQWRAENVPGERGIYLELCRKLDEGARLVAMKDFVAIDRRLQQRIVEQTVFLANSRQSALFYAQVIAVIIQKYLATDVWLARGYESWPGNARGLQSYLGPAPGDDGTR